MNIFIVDKTCLHLRQNKTIYLTIIHTKFAHIHAKFAYIHIKYAPFQNNSAPFHMHILCT